MGDIEECLFKQFFPLVPTNCGKTVIHLEKFAREPDLNDADCGLIERSAEPVFALTQRPLYDMTLCCFFAQSAVCGGEFSGAFGNTILQLVVSPSQLFECPGAL